MNRKNPRRKVVAIADLAPEAPDLITAMSNEIEELREANTALASQVEEQGQIIDAHVPVTLKEWDWDAQNFAEVAYPYSVIKGFIDWMRNTRQWIEDDSGRQVWRKFQRFQETLTDAKNDAAKEAVAA